MMNLEYVVIKDVKKKMSNKEFDFLKDAKVWFVGTLIGGVFSAIGIFTDSKIASFIGLLISSIVTLYYSYQCWQSSQWEEM